MEKPQGAERKHVYLCTDEGGQQTVAKICFSEYPWQLHQELAERSLTPALLPGKREFPGGVRLVEMGYLARAEGWMSLQDFDGDWDEVEGLLRAALQELQQCCGGRAVHGDLREPNLLIRCAGPGQARALVAAAGCGEPQHCAGCGAVSVQARFNAAQVLS